MKYQQLTFSLTLLAFILSANDGSVTSNFLKNIKCLVSISLMRFDVSSSTDNRISPSAVDSSPTMVSIRLSYMHVDKEWREKTRARVTAWLTAI